MGKRTQTRWRRFTLASVPAAVVAAGMMVGIANGAVPVALNVSGDTFKVSASQLEGTGFEQYSSVVVDSQGNYHPVAASEIEHAELTDLCQSVTVPDNPLGITASLMITAGDAGEPAEASNLTIGLDELRGDATFENITIGTDGSLLGNDQSGHELIQGSVGQHADSISIDGLQQTAYSTHAGTFTLNNLRLRIDLSGDECFDWG